MDSAKALSWAEFWVGVGFQRALFPDYVTRVMAADSQKTLRRANVILAIAPFVVQVPLCLYGVAGRAHHPEVSNSKAIFSTVVLDVYQSSAAGAVFGSLMMAATVAGIMSTADSVLIAISQLVTLDLVRPFLLPNGDVHAARAPGGDARAPAEVAALDRKLMRVSRGVTLAVALAAFAIAAPVVESNQNLSFLIKFQSTFLANCAPLFILGLYWRKLGRLSMLAGEIAISPSLAEVAISPAVLDTRRRAAPPSLSPAAPPLRPGARVRRSSLLLPPAPLLRQA